MSKVEPDSKTLAEYIGECDFLSMITPLTFPEAGEEFID